MRQRPDRPGVAATVSMGVYAQTLEISVLERSRAAGDRFGVPVVTISGYLLKEIPRTFRLSVLLRKVHAPGKLDGNFWGLGVHPLNPAHHMCKMLCRVEGRYIDGTQGGAAHRRKGRYGRTSNIGMGTCPASFMETRVLGKRQARPFLPARPRRPVCPTPSTAASMKR